MSSESVRGKLSVVRRKVLVETSFTIRDKAHKSQIDLSKLFQGYEVLL